MPLNSVHLRAHMTTAATAHSITPFSAQLVPEASGPSPADSGHEKVILSSFSTSVSLQEGLSSPWGKPLQHCLQALALGHKALGKW